MKYYLLLLLAITLATAGIAQKEKDEKTATPPAAVKSAFDKAYPGSAKVKWGKEDGDYEAAFTQNNQEMSVVYSSRGMLKETETAIKVSELPAPVAPYIKQHYKGAVIHEAAKIVLPDGTINYEAEVKKLDLVFDANGKFIKAQKD